jgi:hypothetical protein
MAEGRSDREIADNFCVNYRTTTHVANILGKLGIMPRNTATAASTSGVWPSRTSSPTLLACPSRPTALAVSLIAAPMRGNTASVGSARRLHRSGRQCRLLLWGFDDLLPTHPIDPPGRQGGADDPVLPRTHPAPGAG